jgi:hypothetical protein
MPKKKRKTSKKTACSCNNRGLAGSQADHEQAALATIARFERVIEDPRLRHGSCTFKFGRILEMNKMREGAMTDLVWLYRANKSVGQKARRSFSFFDMKRKEFENAFERDCVVKGK